MRVLPARYTIVCRCGIGMWNYHDAIIFIRHTYGVSEILLRVSVSEEITKKLNEDTPKKKKHKE